MLTARDHKEASRIRLDVEGKGCSIQLAAILPKIRDVDRLVDPEIQHRLREGHPEVSFMTMNAGRPMLHAKRLQEGRAERVALLSAQLPGAIDSLAEVGRFIEDAIDACAMLWTARRVIARVCETYPRRPARDSRGLSMVIVA